MDFTRALNNNAFFKWMKKNNLTEASPYTTKISRFRVDLEENTEG